MKASCRPASVAALLLPLLLSGCFMLSTTRKLPVPRPPSIVNTVTPEQLVAQLNQRWTDLNSLTAKVEIQASTLKAKEGVARDYTTIGGIILMRKPEMLRVVGRAPVIGVPIFNMGSDGKTFTLYIPSQKKAYTGPTLLTKRSTNQLENMRPGFFLDALVVRGLDSDDYYSVTADTETVEDAAKKHLYTVPEYVLSITRHNAGSQKDTPERVITFHRDDLLPYQQDIYDEHGNLETVVLYDQYTNYGKSKYPSRVTIKRPLEEFQIVLTVDNVTEDVALKDDQFQIAIPEGTKVQQLH